MISRAPMRFLTAVAIAAVLAVCAPAAEWRSLGPEGGDVRALAYNPHNPDHLLLGTAAGRLFVSHDGGASWRRLVQLDGRNDYVLDNIVFDHTRPGVVFVATWSVADNSRGDLFRSADGGRSWERIKDLHGKSIRALAIAPSKADVLVAGALDGVFRSDDGGATWRRISPQGHPEIRNIESIAIDPHDPDVIYAGTWHLPWKTSDGGRTWRSIKKGMIDDSDVFSIIIDYRDPRVVYASACSGIYKSESGGELFRKIQGIPFSARRTRVLQEDPVNPSVVYAGTTEGLWKSTDAGATWKRVTAANLIINDVLVDPRRPSRVLLATDRAGVLASDNGGLSFTASNRGFAHRVVSSLISDRNDSATLYAGVVNDKDFGGVFVSRDGGEQWRQMSQGLGGRDVFVLRQAGNGALLAGTNRGLWMFASGGHKWEPLTTLVREQVTSKPVRPGSKKMTTTRKRTVSELNGRVADLRISPERWFAATSQGLLASTDSGASWRPVTGFDKQDFIAVAGGRDLIAAATRRTLAVSLDRGENWYGASLPHYLTAVSGVAIDGNGVIWLASREGAFRSADGGDHWDHVLAGLPAKNVSSILYDEDGRRLLAISGSDYFESIDGGRSWRPAGQPGYVLRGVSPSRGGLFLTSAFDGVLAQTEPPRESSAGAAVGAGGGSFR